MEDAGSTEQALAANTGIARTTLRRRLTGKSGFTVDELTAIVEELGLDLVLLLANEPSVA